MYVPTERGAPDNTEATRFSQCAHDQRRRLEAEDCDSIRCAPINFRWEETYTPTTLPRSRSPHNVLHIRLVIHVVATGCHLHTAGTSLAT